MESSTVCPAARHCLMRECQMQKDPDHPWQILRLGVALIGLILGRGPLPASLMGSTCKFQGLIGVEESHPPPPGLDETDWPVT